MLPTEYRAPYIRRNSTFPSIRSLAVAGVRTCGVVVAGPAVLTFAGIRLSAPEGKHAALAASRLTRVGGRIYGTLAQATLTGYEFTDPYDTIAYLEEIESGASWWPLGEAWARAGAWIRRASWTDTARRIRYQAGYGTAAALAFGLSAAVSTPAILTPTDFGATEFLGDDWELHTPGTVVLIDLTDLTFEGSTLAFQVTGSPLPPGDLPDSPASGAYVRMRIDGVEQWVATREYACPGDS